MNELRVEMPVYTIDERPIGVVIAVSSCCVVVQIAERRYFVTEPAVYNVDDHRVTFVCDEESVGRYACRDHDPVAAKCPATVAS